MNALLEALPTLLPLADRSKWVRLGDKFSGRNLEWQSEDLYSLIGLAVAFGVLMLVLRWASKLDLTTTSRQHKTSAYEDLCLAHRLGWRQKRMLKAAAVELELESAEEFFVRPELFEKGAAPPRAVKNADSWAEIGSRLFEEK